MTMRRAVAAALLFFTFPLMAVTIGELQPGGGDFAYPTNPDSSFTVINFVRPALESGTLNSVSLMWSTSSCAGSIKVKVLRRNFEFQVLYVAAERGPFNASAGANTFVLSPGIPIEEGDFIGITHLRGPSCGGVLHTSSSFAEFTKITFGDPAVGSTITNALDIPGRIPNIAGSMSPSTEILHGYVIAVGSLRGGFGSQFKTALQLSNPGSVQITGKLVFHPAGTPAQPTDPSISYTIDALKTISYEDVVQTLGRSGLGTLDVVTTKGYPPNVAVRIFNDQGASGTSGLTEELKTPYEKLETGQSGALTIPANLTDFRLNIGYRTLDEAVELKVQVYDKDGVLIPGEVARFLNANTFDQLSGAQFTGRATLPAGGSIVIRVMSGSVFVYGAVTDNRTNDGNLYFAKRY